MNGFKCKVTNSTSNVALAKPQLPRRCGADPNNGRPEAAPGNCTYGAKQPFYWLQQEHNNVRQTLFLLKRLLTCFIRYSKDTMPRHSTLICTISRTAPKMISSWIHMRASRLRVLIPLLFQLLPIGRRQLPQHPLLQLRLGQRPLRKAQCPLPLPTPPRRSPDRNTNYGKASFP